MYRLVFYVPEAQAESVKGAVFAAGGGKFRNYARCCWQTAGTGQFEPLENSVPFLGRRGRLETVTELKIEMIVADECIRPVVCALKTAHPYEEPAYSVIRLEEY